MSEEVEYRCFIGNLSWGTSDTGLKEAFQKYGRVVDSKVVMDKITGRSRGFGFVAFDEKIAMEEAIAAMNGMDLDGRAITVDKAQADRGGAGDRDGGRDRDHDRDRSRSYRDNGGGRGSGGGDCYRCGKPGHFARECPGEGGRGGKYGGREDRYGGRDDRYGGGGRDDRYGGGGGGGGSRGGDRYGPDRNGDRYGGRSRDGGGGDGERYSRDRSGPYDRRGGGGFRSG